MADKPGFSVASGFQGGVTIGIAANTWPEFVAFCESTWPGEGLAVANGLYDNLRNHAGLMQLPTEQQAVQMVQQQLAGQVIRESQYSAPTGPVGYQQAPPAQQQYQQQPPQYQQPQPQNGPPPGQMHDPKYPTKTKWVAAGVSKKTGKPYAGFWTTP